MYLYKNRMKKTEFDYSRVSYKNVSLQLLTFALTVVVVPLIRAIHIVKFLNEKLFKLISRRAAHNIRAPWVGMKALLREGT